MAISSTLSTLNLKDIVVSLLSEEMRQKYSKDIIKDPLFIRGHSLEKNKYKLEDKQSKYRDKSISPRIFVKK